MKPLVVVTGASSGFGKAMAKEFHDAGYPLLLLARRVEILEGYGFPDTICRQVDVRDKESFEKAVREAEGIYGPADLLINNAGVMFLGSLEDQDPSEWQKMLDINVVGVMNGMQIVMEDMKKRHHGTIVNFSSIAGVKPFVNHAGYCASKYAVAGMSEVARMELASSDVRVIRILPGAVNTSILDSTANTALKDDYYAWLKATGVGRIRPEDIARTVFFAYSMPQEVNIREIQITDTRQDA